MRSRGLRDGVVVVFRCSVVHAGALKVVSCAHGMLRQDRARDRARLITKSCKGGRPGAWVAILDVPDGCEDLPNSCTHGVCDTEATEQLEVHLWISEAAHPRCGTGDAIFTGRIGHGAPRSGPRRVRRCQPSY